MLLIGGGLTHDEHLPHRKSEEPANRPEECREKIEVVAMNGFTGFKTAAAQELPDAVPVLDPFHAVQLGGDALDDCRRRVQQATCGHRGRKDDPLYRVRRTLHSGARLLTPEQQPASARCSTSRSTSRSRLPGASATADEAPFLSFTPYWAFERVEQNVGADLRIPTGH